MSDPTELAGVGVGGLTIGGILVGLLKVAGSRNITALDDTLKSLRTSVEVLAKDVRDLREANIGLAKDIGSLTRRVEEQDKEIAGLRRQLHRWGNFLQRIALKTATGEHAVEMMPEGDE
jgi:chromosome segregation ATPase